MSAVAVTDPYGRLGLRGNPFASDRCRDMGPATFVPRGLPTPAAGEVVEIVGDSGAGKTTQLHRWLSLLGGGTYHYVEPVRRHRARVPAPPGVVAWDEVDRLSPRTLTAAIRRARRAGATVLIGTHRVTGVADRSHRLPALSVRDAREMVERRTASSAAAGAAGVAASVLVPEAELQAMVRASGGCWWTLGTLLHERTALLAADPAREPAWGRVEVARTPRPSRGRSTGSVPGRSR